MTVSLVWPYTTGPISNFEGGGLSHDVNLKVPKMILRRFPPARILLSNVGFSVGITQDGVHQLINKIQSDNFTAPGIQEALDRNPILNVSVGKGIASKGSLDYVYADPMAEEVKVMKTIRELIIDPAAKEIRDQIVDSVKDAVSREENLAQ